MNQPAPTDAYLENVAFIGQSLGPFFLEDPLTGNAQAAFEAIAALDKTRAAGEWPFAGESTALKALTLMQEGLAQGSNSEDVVWEYRRLFIGPNIKPTPPWSSVYTDKECVVFGQSCLDLRAWMRANGIERTTDEKTPEDHIGLLLLLMVWIAANKPELLDEYLRLHVLTWSSHFLEQLYTAAKQPFYQGLALLTHASLEGIQQERGITVEYPRFYR